MRGRTLRAAVGVLGLLAAGGCGSGPREVEQARALPAGLVQRRVVDVQVIRVRTSIAVTNTTARALPAGTLWVNGRFSRAFEGLGVGESVVLELSGFEDEFGERFRAGGFFATQDRDPVVLAQLEVPAASEGGQAELIGLIALSEQER
jgi:hypothetical protein